MIRFIIIQQVDPNFHNKMQQTIKPYLIHFAGYQLPRPQMIAPTHHPNFLPQPFIATMPNKKEYRCQLIHLHLDNYIQQFQDIQTRIQLNGCQGLVRFQGFHVEFQLKGVVMYVLYEMEQQGLREGFGSYSTREEGFWRVAFPIIRSLAYLQKRKIVHGNLNYYNMLVTKDNSIRLLYNVGQPSSIDLYYLDSKGSDWDYLFLSPEQIDSENVNDIQNRFKSDVFNLGAILLTLLVQTKEGVYGDENYLSRQLSSLKLKYSYSLCNILCKMLELDYRKRPNFFELSLALDELQKSVERVALTESRLYSDTARRMTRDLLSTVDLKETRKTQISEFV